MRDALPKDQLGTGRRFAIMRARLQTDIEGTFSEQSPVSHRVYGDDFGMGHAGTVVVALTDDTPMSHKDCSDKRIGRGEPFGILC